MSIEPGGSGHRSELDAGSVLGLLQELSDRLAARGAQAQLFVVGGAAMALAYDQDRLTRDVDTLFVPAPLVREIAQEMSAEHALDRTGSTMP
jgi:methylmalonyl-CoA mutase cobalamin-binding subunit